MVGGAVLLKAVVRTVIRLFFVRVLQYWLEAPGLVSD
jgi:hypothetical protein